MGCLIDVLGSTLRSDELVKLVELLGLSLRLMLQLGRSLAPSCSCSCSSLDLIDWLDPATTACPTDMIRLSFLVFQIGATFRLVLLLLNSC